MTKTNFRCVLQLLFVLLLGGISVAVAKVPEAVLAKKKAVVTFYIEQNKEIIASGSGFIITENGIVVTNNHVIESWNGNKDSLLYIENSDGIFLSPVELIASDADKDVALLKVEENNLPFIQLSGSTPKEGEDVVVIGSPLGLSTTITTGIISNIRGNDGLLQISAPISPGSSGSPVLNSNGEAIGMATLLMEGGQNLNFAIPASYIFASIRNLSKEKHEDLERQGVLELDKEEAHTPPAALEENPDSVISDHFVKILSIQNSAEYSYAEYDEDGARGWVAFKSDAVTKQELIPGDYVIFPDSPPMIDVLAKGLDKTFDKLIYAPSLQIVKIKEGELKSARDKDAFLISKMIDYESFLVAANKIEKYLAKNPDNAEMYFLRAKLITSQLQIPVEDTPGYQQILETNKELCQSAYDNLSYAISLDNQRDEYFSDRGALLTNRYECNYYDPENAVNDYEAAIKLNPNVVDYYISKGNIHNRLKQLPKLLECAKEAIRIDPDNGEGYYLYGEYYFKRNEFDKALTYGKKSLMSKNRGFFSTMGFINLIMMQYPKYDETVKLYSDLIKKFPKDSMFYGERGRYNLLSKSYKNAITDFTKGIDLSPDSTDYYRFRGDAYRADGNFNAALSDYNHACNSNDSNACEKVEAVRADIRRGPNWILAGVSSDTDHYFDKTSIVRNKNGNITVWIKGEITNKDGFIFLDEQELEKDKYNNVSHTLVQLGFDCQGRQLKTLNYLMYADTGNTLYSHANEEAKFTSVIPDSIGAILLDNVCKFIESKNSSEKGRLPKKSSTGRQ